IGLPLVEFLTPSTRRLRRPAIREDTLPAAHLADVYGAVQTCVLHLIRNSFRYASKADWAQLAKRRAPGLRLRRADRGGGQGGARGAQREVGRALPGDHPALAQRGGSRGCRRGRVRTRPRRYLLDERDREHARTLPPRRPRPRPLPQ